MNTKRLAAGASVALSAACVVGACGGSGDGGGGESGGAGGSGNAGGSAGVGIAGFGDAPGSGGSGLTSTGGTTGDAGQSGAGGEDGCATTTQKAELSTANLLFVIDKSGSMNCNPPEGDAALNARCENFPRKEDPNLPSKWEVTIDALVNAIDTLAEQPNVRAGVSLFPKNNACLVEADPELGIAALDAAGRADISDLLANVVPAGETPIAGATILSYAHLAQALHAAELEGNTFVVLLTDGAETCRPTELPKLLSEDVPNSRLYGIRTFVIGAPGSEQARSLLSEIAWEGGTAADPSCDHSGSQPDAGDCHFDMTQSTDLATDLNAALEEISRTTILPCVFDIPENPDGGDLDFNKVNVTFTSGSGSTERILRNDTGDCDSVDGWQYSPDATKIMLCGAACNLAEADSRGQVRIVIGCPTVVVR